MASWGRFCVERAASEASKEKGWMMDEAIKQVASLIASRPFSPDIGADVSPLFVERNFFFDDSFCGGMGKEQSVKQVGWKVEGMMLLSSCSVSPFFGWS